MINDIPACNPEDLKPKQVSYPIAKVVPKGWGEELWITNNDLYCGKILRFEKGSQCSMHYHLIKNEHFYISRGDFLLITINPATAKKESKLLVPGDTVEIPRGCPHKVKCSDQLNGEIIEFSTTHYEFDSYRIEPGDSQQV